MRVAAPALPVLPRFRWPSERTRAPSRCTHCGARLLAARVPTADEPSVDVACLFCGRTVCELVSDGLRERRPLTDEELRPRRGRPVGATSQTSRKKTQPCPDCAIVLIRVDAQRCLDCDAMRRYERGLTGRLIALLIERGAPVHRNELMQTFNLLPQSLRSALERARRRGYQITVERRTGMVRLEGER